jgi:hypothetical protein
MNVKKKLTIGTVPKSNKKIVGRGKINIFNNKNTGPHIFLDWHSCENSLEIPKG